MNICLTLPSRTAVRSATFFGEEIAAVDGLHTRIFLFDTCGTCIESVNSLRCYSLLRYDPVSNGFVARCDTCGNRVFYLNCFFAEIGTASLGSLACEGPLYDVTMYDGRLYATFEDRVVAYTRDGSPLCTVVRPRPGVATRHYIRSGDESLTHIVRDGQSYIVHSSDGCGAGLVVPRGQFHNTGRRHLRRVHQRLPLYISRAARVRRRVPRHGPVDVQHYGRYRGQLLQLDAGCAKIESNNRGKDVEEK